MTDKELISKIQLLKQIKPHQNWVVLTKNKINGVNIPTKVIQPSFGDIVSSLLSFASQRRMAYAFASLMVVLIGTFGVMQYMSKGVGEVSVKEPAALVAIKSDVEELKAKSKDLAELSKSNPESVSLALKEVEEIAKDLTVAIEKDSKLALVVALDINENKNYLNIADQNNSEEAVETLDTLYKTMTEKLLEDYENVTLPKDKQESLNIIKEDFYNGKYEGKYSNALEDVLIFSSTVRERERK